MIFKGRDNYFFDCACYNREHTLRFDYDKDDKEFTTSIFLNQYHNFFKRIWIAIKYIFKYKCRYGHFDTWILRYQDIDKMIKMLKEVKDDNE